MRLRRLRVPSGEAWANSFLLDYQMLVNNINTDNRIMDIRMLDNNITGINMHNNNSNSMHKDGCHTVPHMDTLDRQRTPLLLHRICFATMILNFPGSGFQ